MSKSVQKVFATVEVADAAAWAEFLVDQATRRRPDRDPVLAMGDVARNADVPRSRLYSLVRRPQILKDIGASIYVRLRDAYVAERQRQAKALQHELEILAATGRDRSVFARAAARVGGVAAAGEKVSS